MMIIKHVAMQWLWRSTLQNQINCLENFQLLLWTLNLCFVCTRFDDYLDLGECCVALENERSFQSDVQLWQGYGPCSRAWQQQYSSDKA